ncbi:uncharacterized protein LOC118756269, partial [Rhagoletis pomonella]|uniref:uncharacterized protein LOC118756269 n=1 Tax=Rhagoletis pomonella TaxID=28610 RepID=UPI00177B86ED
MHSIKDTSTDYHCRNCRARDNEQMVQCDSCDQWFHYSCVGVDSQVADISWNCESCEHTSVQMAAAFMEPNGSNNGGSLATGQPRASSSPEAAHQSQQAILGALSSIPVQSTVMVPSIYTAPRMSTTSASVPPYSTAALEVTLHDQIRFQSSSSTTELYTLSSASGYPATMYTQNSKNHLLPNSFILQKLPTSSTTFPSLQTNAKVANPSIFAKGSQNSDTSERMRALQLERLEEEMRIQKQYLDDKYKILAQFGELTNSGDRIPIFNVTPTPAQLAARHSIPKQLPIFSGDPEEWPLFISQFENSTSVAGYSNVENLMRLQACLKGRARDLVKNKLLLPAMVPEIIQTLRMCCGRPEHILERAINKAKNMAPLKDKLESLIEFSLCVQNICATMEGCNLTAHLVNPLLVKELVDKLPNSYKLSWAMQPKDDRVPIVKIFSDWLYNIAEAASTVVAPMTHKSGVNVNTHTRAEDVSDQRSETNSLPRKCCVCKTYGHKLPRCEAFKALPLKRKWEIVKEHSLCRQCLDSHRRKCYVNKECGITGCKYKHHQLLHRSASQTVDSSADNNINSRQIVRSSNIPSDHANRQMIAHSSSATKNSPYFRIIPVKLYSHNKVIETFAFLDEGSAVTLMEKSVFEQMELKGVQEPLCLRWTGDTTRTEYNSFKTTVEIPGVTNGRKYKLTDAHTVESLSLPTQTIDAGEIMKKYPYLTGLPIESYENARPSILIGTDNWKLAVPLKIREGSWFQPIASKTRLGWTLQGCHANQSREFMVNVHTCDCEKSLRRLHEAVKNYFNLEEPKPKQLLSADDNKALAILNASCKKVSNRYEVGLLWRNEDVVLPESYGNAYKRLMCLERKFNKDPLLKSTIQQQIDNLISKGYAKKLSPAEATIQPSKTWYLPIFTVTNPNKPGKIRLVWDAAAKANGVCLNDFMFPGPDLLNSLVEVLLSFRVGRVAVCGDVAEMFHQINIRESDMHAQRFLWWDEADKPQQPSVYVMRALTFGVNCAPCIAHFIRDNNAEQFRHEFPRAVEAVQRYHYVDDFIDSERDEETALELAKQVKRINANAGFEVRNWVSNSHKVLQQLASNNPIEPALKEWGSTTKILGLKILLQDVWRSDIGWDEALSDALYDKWESWKSNIPLIMDVKVPRCYSTILHSSDNVQLHTFVDASSAAFAAVSYLRIQRDSNVDIAFVAAKSKVAPLKPVSIPRLELQAAVAGFNDESLRSALWEIEFIINSRPLTFVSLESDDDEAITPNHLLIGSSDGYKPFATDNKNLRQ